jgi:hypothetical protein
LVARIVLTIIFASLLPRTPTNRWIGGNVLV